MRHQKRWFWLPVCSVAVAVAVGVGVGVVLAQGDASLQAVLRDVAGLVAGTYGSGAGSVVLTVDRKGRITSVSETPIQFPAPPPASSAPFAAAVTAPKQFTVGTNCSVPAPCLAAYGEVVGSFTGPVVYTITNTATGTMRVALTPQMVVTAYVQGITLSCTGPCAVVPVAAVPANVKLLWEASVTAGNFDAATLRDFRAALYWKEVTGGFGTYTTDVGGKTIIGVDPALVRTPKTFINTATGIILGTEHSVASPNVSVSCFTVDGTRRRAAVPLDVWVDPATRNVEIMMPSVLASFHCFVL